MKFLKYLGALFLFYAGTAWAADTGKIDYDAILDEYSVVTEYQSEVEKLKNKVLNEYSDLEDKRIAAISDDYTEPARDKIVAEIADVEADIIKEWLSGLVTINAKYDNQIIALDEKIQNAITAVMEAKQLKFIQDGPLEKGQSDNQMVDITQDVIKKLKGE